jgi:hypothetical protein
MSKVFTPDPKVIVPAWIGEAILKTVKIVAASKPSRQRK